MSSNLLINGSYPIDLFGKEQTRTSNAGGVSFWSSAERRADVGEREYLSVVLKRQSPINRISMKVSDKPMDMRIWYSTDLNESSAVFHPWLTIDGEQAMFSVDRWGAGSGLVPVSFDLEPRSVRMIRLTFDRKDIPDNSLDGTTQGLRFPYSIEVSNLMFEQVVLAADTFMPATYEDMFGNVVRATTMVHSALNTLDAQPKSAWISQPNVTSLAVEWIAFDIGVNGEPQTFDMIDVDPIYGGCQMNVYVSDDDTTDYAEKEWAPVPGIYALDSFPVSVPIQIAKFVKLEFTNLMPVPYTASEVESVDTLLFPGDIAVHANARSVSDGTVERYEYGLLLPSGETPTGEETIGLPDGSEQMRQQTAIRERILDKGIPDDYPSLWENSSYQGDLRWGLPQDNFGEHNITVEYSPEERIIKRPIVSQFNILQLKFLTTGKHEYDRRTMPRERDIAYLVGIRDVVFSHQASNVMFETGREWVETFAAPVFQDTSSWGNDGSRLVYSDAPSVYVSELFASIHSFQVIEFLAHHRELTEKFDNVSFVDGTDGWNNHGDATISWEHDNTYGNVLKAERSGAGAYGGAVTDLIGIQMGGYSEFSTDIFVPDDVVGEWYIEVMDFDDATVIRRRVFPDSGKWSRISVPFLTQPSGTWSADYDYRCRIVIVAGESVIPAGSAFNIRLDTKYLVSDGKMRADRQDLRAMYFNGTILQEIHRDYTGPTDAAGDTINGTDEIWIRIQKDIKAGESDDGYFLYYGNVDPPPVMGNLASIFHEMQPSSVTHVLSASGLTSGGITYGENLIVPAAEGSVSLFYKPTGDWLTQTASVTDESVTLTGTDAVYLDNSFVTASPVVKSTGGTPYTEGVDYDWEDGTITRIPAGGIASGQTVLVSYSYLSGMRRDGDIAVRTLFCGGDNVGRYINISIEQMTLVFEYTEPPEVVDGEVSVYTSTTTSDISHWANGVEHHIVGAWGPVTIDPLTGSRRRLVGLFVDGAEVSDADQNRYDVKVYDEGYY